MRVVARRLPPAAISMRAVSTSPLDAAQCSAVMPSPCAPLTSAPSLSSALTATPLRCIAASATGALICARTPTDKPTVSPIAIAARAAPERLNALNTVNP